jgi:hypothetical protein
MAYQECALYGDLVRYLRDRCTERLAELDSVSAARLRHDRAFIERISCLIPLHARIWLRGWSDALTHAAFAQAVDWDDELPF